MLFYPPVPHTVIWQVMEDPEVADSEFDHAGATLGLLRGWAEDTELADARRADLTSSGAASCSGQSWGAAAAAAVCNGSQGSRRRAW